MTVILLSSTELSEPDVEESVFVAYGTLSPDAATTYAGRLRSNGSAFNQVAALRDDPFASALPTMKHFLVDRNDMATAYQSFFDWLQSPACDEVSYRFNIAFKDENATGDGVIREFFRVLWDDFIMDAFFTDTEISGHPLPSIRLDKLKHMKALGKFIALSLRHAFLPNRIHPLCYLRLPSSITWQYHAVLYDPFQTKAFPKTYAAFKTLSPDGLMYYDERYAFESDICAFTEVSTETYPFVLDQFYKRMVFNFPVQRCLQAVSEGISAVRNFTDKLQRTLLSNSDSELMFRFEESVKITAERLLNVTTFEPTKDSAKQITYETYRQALARCTKIDLSRWVLFVTNRVQLSSMRVSVGSQFCVRTCFGTVQFGQCYAHPELMLADMKTAMFAGLNTKLGLLDQTFDS